MKKLYDFFWKIYLYIMESMELAKSMYYQNCVMCNKKKIFIPIPGHPKESRIHVCQGCIKTHCIRITCEVCQKDYFVNDKDRTICVYCEEELHYKELSNPVELKGMLQDFNNAF